MSEAHRATRAETMGARLLGADATRLPQMSMGRQEPWQPKECDGPQLLSTQSPHTAAARDTWTGDRRHHSRTRCIFKMRLRFGYLWKHELLKTRFHHKTRPGNISRVECTSNQKEVVHRQHRHSETRNKKRVQPLLLEHCVASAHNDSDFFLCSSSTLLKPLSRKQSLARKKGIPKNFDPEHWPRDTKFRSWKIAFQIPSAFSSC